MTRCGHRDRHNMERRFHYAPDHWRGGRKLRVRKWDEHTRRAER